MTLRSPFQRQQLLFLAACAFLVGGAVSSQAQAPAAQDVIILTTGQQQVGKVLGVTPSGVQVQITLPNGSTGAMALQLNRVKEVRMAAPSEWLTAQKSFEARNYDAALVALRSLEKFKGLPTDWAQQAAAMVGDVHIAKGDIPKAEAAYADFQKLYGGAQSGPQTEVGLARLAMAKKDIEGAKAKLAPITEKALQEKNVPPALGAAYAQAFLLSGQIKEQENDLVGALENYLRTVTLFYQDRTAVVQAQEKADALRKAHPGLFIP